MICVDVDFLGGWMAWVAGTEDEGMIWGGGTTQQAAVASLFEQLDEQEEN